MNDQLERIMLSLLRNPRSWPLYPVLPVFRYKAGETLGKQLGVILVGGERPYPRVYVGINVFDSGPATWHELLASATEVKDYPSVEACVDDGWRTD